MKGEGGTIRNFYKGPLIQLINKISEIEDGIFRSAPFESIHVLSFHFAEFTSLSFEPISKICQFDFLHKPSFIIRFVFNSAKSVRPNYFEHHMTIFKSNQISIRNFPDYYQTITKYLIFVNQKSI